MSSTDQDIASKILFENKPLNTICVNEFIEALIPGAAPETSYQNRMHLMEKYIVRHLVVLDGFEFTGVVSAYNLMQEALHKSARSFIETELPRQG